jgi:enterochelin esterase-like enzyme
MVAKKTVGGIFTIAVLAAVSCLASIPAHAGNDCYADTVQPAVIDTAHYSTVFGEVRHYRIYLPPAYSRETGRRFPVIYFLHGWSQRYFGPVGNGYADFDAGLDNGGDNILNFVKRHPVIVVKMDGYDQRAGEKYNVRPYNIGPVQKTFRQFPVYFPELVAQIDGCFRTIPDRNHRGIAGLSMGGFMAYWMAGKYPQMVSVAGSFCGSTEFEVGPKDLQVEYKHEDFYKNYNGVRVRLHYGDKDFIRSYQEELNSACINTLQNYSYSEYKAQHAACGLADMFNFMLQSFTHPPAVPANWNHIEVYPAFSVWGYDISSDRDIPGFTVLENVCKNGFKMSVREFLPDGPLLPAVGLVVMTDAVYKKNFRYTIKDRDLISGKNLRRRITSDNNGRLKISLNGSVHEVAINNTVSKPNLVFAAYQIKNAGWVVPHQKIVMTVSVLNKGFGAAQDVKAEIYTASNNVRLLQKKSAFRIIKQDSISEESQPFEFIIENDSASLVQFKLCITDKQGNAWTSYFELPVKKQVLEMPEYTIADGKIFTVSRAATDSENIFLGAGNGDGIPNPGESIVILVKDKALWRRTLLFSSDNYLNPSGQLKRKSDNWSNYDYTGASVKYSIPLIASNCPPGHVITMYCEYTVPGEKPYHIKKGMKVEIKVAGVDKVAPLLEWGKATNGNRFYVKLLDGAGIQLVRARFTPVFDDIDEYLGEKIKAALQEFTVILNDNGVNGDSYSSDNIFSCTIQPKIFCLYTVNIEATDSFGNFTSHQLKERVALY